MDLIDLVRNIFGEGMLCEKEGSPPPPEYFEKKAEEVLELVLEGVK